MAGSAMLFHRRHVWSCIVTIASVLTIAAGAVAASPAANPRGPAAQEAVTGQSGPGPTVPVFEMHSGFWVNLHHFLYLQARLLNHDSFSTDAGRGAAQPDEAPVSVSDLPAGDVRVWQDAVAFYAKDLAGRDLLLNGDMEIINNQLGLMESCPDLEGKTSPLCKSGLRPDLVEALENAAPVYRAHWWEQQDRSNHEWIAQVTPIIQKMGVELSSQLAEVYQHPWPSQRLRVDVVWYGGPYGAYTSLDPVHITISSHDPRNRGAYGFEVLFHEASHALAGAVNATIAREFRERDKPIPRDFAYALLFYTTGEMVRRDIEYGTMYFTSEQTNGPSSYLPYAARFGLYSGSWEHFRALLDTYWLPYLDGRVSFDTAMARMAAEM